MNHEFFFKTILLLQSKRKIKYFVLQQSAEKFKNSKTKKKYS